MVQFVRVIDRLSLHADDLSGNADYRGFRGHVVQYDGICTDTGIVTDRDRTEYLGAGTDEYIVTECRMTLPFL